MLCYQLEKTIKVILERFINFSNTISKGEFDKSTFDSSLDYLNPGFSSILGDLTFKLNNIFSELKKEKNELEAILDAMSEGVIVVSRKGIITLVNKSAESMFELAEEYIGKSYWEVLRNKQLHELVSDTLKSQKGLKKEINIVYPEAKYYLASTISLDNPSEEIIAVIFDITEFKKLENIKADFIANVSHELRTPLTSIKGYSETIEDGAYKNEAEMKQFLKIITRNTDRLISIVSDLLILSELEGKDSLFSEDSDQDFEQININEVILQTVASLNRKIKDKEIREKIDLEDNMPRINGIKFFLEQMITNLIDNSIKYNHCGGEVNINTYSNENKVVIKISDTGIGIPKEQQDRIFERFYRVDKNRSREIGGTGLGLSIVKHIVLVHGGNINLVSEEENGSEFTIELPIVNEVHH
ncbi:MAG: sensor histidine kinase [Thermodesulfobacteriota bacterium]